MPAKSSLLTAGDIDGCLVWLTVSTFFMHVLKVVPTPSLDFRFTLKILKVAEVVISTVSTSAAFASPR